MDVEIWSDVVCPWCYVGKRRFEAALTRFEHRDQVEVRWRSFELDPNAPRLRPGPYVERLAGKYAMSVAEAQGVIDHIVAVGADNDLVLDFAIAQPGNTFDAHRLLHLAHQRGHQDALKERMMAANFTEGAAIGDPDVLAKLAADVGLDPGEVAEVLAGHGFAAEVRADEQRAAQLGINAVPFFVMGGRYGVAGAQSPEVLLQVLQDSWDETERTDTTPDADACADDSCAVTP
jgi:predicted DsbA family dithiol-disulfide isomerase